MSAKLFYYIFKVWKNRREIHARLVVGIKGQWGKRPMIIPVEIVLRRFLTVFSHNQSFSAIVWTILPWFKMRNIYGNSFCIDFWNFTTVITCSLPIVQPGFMDCAELDNLFLECKPNNRLINIVQSCFIILHDKPYARESLIL